jgi:hypothetical protein
MSNDHLVSKTYLKWFENNEINKVYCTSYRETRGLSQWSSVSQKDRAQICYEIDRYESGTEEVFQQRFENDWDLFIQHLNQFDFKTYTNNHYKKNIILTNDQVILVLNFMIIHYKRSVRFKEQNKKDQAVTSNLKQLQKELKRELTQKDIDKFHKTVDNLIAQEPQLESVEKLKKIPWILYINNSKTPFITSSTPVIWHNEIEGIGIFSPITPSFSILIPFLPLQEKEGIFFENINDKDVEKFNQLTKEANIKDNPGIPMIISNRKDVLQTLTTNLTPHQCPPSPTPSKN